MKVAIYARVSTQDQNLDNQIIPLIKYCEAMEWEYDIYREKESTRKTRPVQNELYLKLLRREYGGLLIYKFDRWARTTSELITQIQSLVKKGITPTTR